MAIEPADAPARAADAPTEQGQAVDSIKVLTVNTHKGFSALNRRFVLPELRDAVRALSADVVFLQEVLGRHSGHGERYDNWSDTPQYEFLADSMWPVYAYGRNAVYPEGDHGNALLSKFPILRHDNLDVTVSGHEERGLLHSVLQVPGRGEVHTVCIHLGLHESQRQMQLKLLCQLLESLGRHEPVIVAGDFNDWRLKASGVLEACGLKEVFTQAYGAPARSFPARFPWLRLDRIYLRNAEGHCPQVLSRKPWSHLSDHVPLAVEVRL